MKSVAVVEVLLFGGFLGRLQVMYNSRATDIFGIINSTQKTIGISTMIATSVLWFPVDKFRKSENRDGYKQINNEPQHETV